VATVVEEDVAGPANLGVPEENCMRVEALDR
jgi:hypothetical protein